MVQHNNKYIKYILILIAFIFFGCEKVNTNKKNSGFVISTDAELQLVEIDSCEYFFGDWGNASVLTHKGNCKFCEQSKPKLK
jgi:hypothetical protein